MKKILPFALSLIGVALFTFLAAKAGVHPILAALGKVGLSGFALLALGQICVDIGLGFAWKGSIPSIGFLRLTASRFVRDAAACCLPFSQLGGMVIGVRATMAGRDPRRTDGRRLHWPETVAANLVDITTEVLGQIAFVLLALLCLAWLRGTGHYVWPLAGGMIFLTLGIAGFIWTQHKGGVFLNRAVHFLGRHIAADWRHTLIDNTEEFQEKLEAFWNAPDRITYGAALHLLCWFGSAGLTWMALSLLGASVSPAEAVAIEGVVCGIMSAGFFVPGSLGVQEGAYVALGLLFGIETDISLSLSLLRRGRDILIGVPALLLWQGAEIRRLRYGLSDPAPSPSNAPSSGQEDRVRKVLSDDAF